VDSTCLGHGQQGVAGLGQHQPIAVTVEQPRAHRPFQAFDPAGHRAVFDPQPPGGRAEPSQARHRQKIAQIVPVDFAFHPPSNTRRVEHPFRAITHRLFVLFANFHMLQPQL
jgi:hypothetical protein